MHTCKIEQIYCNIVCKTLEKPYKRKYCVAVESRIMWYYLIKKIKQDLKATSFTDKKKYSNCTEINFRFEWRKRKGSFSLSLQIQARAESMQQGAWLSWGGTQHWGTMPMASEARCPGPVKHGALTSTRQGTILTAVKHIFPVLMHTHS